MELIDRGKELGDSIAEYNGKYNENVARKLFK